MSKLDTGKGKTRNVENDLREIADSISKKGHEMLSIYIGCSGCIEGFYKVGYLIWKEEGKEHVVKIDVYNKYSPVILNNSQVNEFLLNNQSELLKVFAESGSSKPDLMHFHYENVNINWAQIKGSYTVYDNKAEDPDIQRFIDRIKAVLFEVEKRPNNWGM